MACAASGSFESELPATTRRTDQGRSRISSGLRSHATSSGKQTTRARFASPRPNGRRPPCCSNRASGPFFLAVNARYSMSVARGDAEAWQSVYRFREQLLMHLISHATSYLARPGIVRF